MAEVDDLLKEIGDLESEGSHSSSQAAQLAPAGGVEVQWLEEVTESDSSSEEPDLTNGQSKDDADADAVAELQQCLEVKTREVAALRLEVAKAQEERDVVILQLTESEEEWRRDSRKMQADLQEARRRESSLQEQAEHLQQNMEVALAEAKTAKAHVQELQGMLATAAAEAARPRPVSSLEEEGEAELKVLKEKLGLAEKSAERDRLKVAELSRALAEAPAMPAVLPAPPAEPVEEPTPDCFGNGRRKLCTGSLEALRVSHRHALVARLRSFSARRRVEEADATVAALRRAQRQLRELAKDLQSQPLRNAVGTQTETVPMYSSTAKTALVSALASPARATNARWTGEKQFAAMPCAMPCSP